MRYDLYVVRRQRVNETKFTVSCIHFGSFENLIPFCELSRFRIVGRHSYEDKKLLNQLCDLQKHHATGGHSTTNARTCHTTQLSQEKQLLRRCYKRVVPEVMSNNFL